VSEKETVVLRFAVLFLIIALIAGALGLFGVAAISSGNCLDAVRDPFDPLCGLSLLPSHL
jgi:hypothetical protein